MVSSLLRPESPVWAECWPCSGDLEQGTWSSVHWAEDVCLTPSFGDDEEDGDGDGEEDDGEEEDSEEDRDK